MLINPHNPVLFYRYISLIYLGFFFIHPIYAPYDSWKILLQAIALIIFLVCYFSTPKHPLAWQWLPISVIISLGYILAPINYGASVFFPYAGYMVGQLLRTSQVLFVLALICLGCAATAWLLGLPSTYWLTGLIITPAVTLFSIADKKSQLNNEKLKRSQEEVEQLAKLAERERIAQDLHDLLGHSLSSIIVKTELLSRLLGQNPEKVLLESRQIQTLAREALQQIRATVNDYRYQGFNQALIAVTTSLEQAGIRVNSTIDCDHFAPRQEAALCMILREATTNIIRHAQADTCEIRLLKNPQGVELHIKDNGMGIHPVSKQGNGLRGIAERVAALQGEFAVQSQPGTALSIRLPRMAP